MVWENPEDGAYATYEPGSLILRITVPGTANFRIGVNSTVVAEHSHEVSRVVVESAYRRVALPLILQAVGMMLLHATAIQSGEGVIILCGKFRPDWPSIVDALTAHGYSLSPGDMVAIAIDKIQTSVMGLQCRSFSRQIAKTVVSQGVPRHCVQGPLKAVVFLEGKEGRPSEVPDLKPADALMRVVEHSVQVNLSPAATFERQFNLVAQTRFRSVAFSENSEHQGELLNALQELA